MSLNRKQAATHDLPALARYVEEIAGGVALYDVSPLVPKGKGGRGSRAYPGPARSGVPIDRFFVHHSGALGRSGFEGAWLAVDFMTRPKPPFGTGRGFPMSGYHLWGSYEPVVDVLGRLVVMQLAPFEARAWHTGTSKAATRGELPGANDRGIGFALQGNTSRRPVSPFQEELLEATIPWAIRKWEMPPADALSWHSISESDGGSPKPACPGKHAESWLKGYRRGMLHAS